MQESQRKAHETAEDAINVYLEEFKNVIHADGFMAAIWVIVEGRLQLVCCTTHNFPLEDRPTAEAQLREVNKSEAIAAMTPPPLPLADHLRPMSFPVPGNNNDSNKHEANESKNNIATDLGDNRFQINDDESEVVSEEDIDGEDTDAFSN